MEFNVGYTNCLVSVELLRKTPGLCLSLLGGFRPTPLVLIQGQFPEGILNMAHYKFKLAIWLEN